MPDHLSDFCAPETGARNDDIRRDDAVGGLDAGDAAVRLLDPGDGGVAQVRDARGFSALDQQLDCACCQGQAIGGDVEATKDVLFINEGIELLAFLAGEDLALDAPRSCVTQLALQVSQTGLSGGDLEATHLVEAALAIFSERKELLHGVFGKERHGL